VTESTREATERGVHAAVKGLVAAALGFALVATIGRYATPWPENFEVTVKLPWLEQHAGEFNALFLGSSEVYRSYVPRTIDERVGAHGIELRSFNLAAPSMFSFETDFVLRRALDVDGLELDWVFLQPGDWDPRPRSDEELDNMLSNRSVFWHDTRQLGHVLESLTRIDAPVSEKLDLALRHAHAWAWKLTSYGQGRRILKDLLGRASWEYQPIRPREVAADHGYQALEDSGHPALEARRRLLLDDVEGYREKIRSVQAANAAPLAADAYCRERLAEQIELVRAAGAEPIFVIPPSSIAQHHALRLAEEGAIRLIAFNDPERYPIFYTAAAHFDPNHLSREGAARFSRAFADELVEFLLSEDGD